SAPPFAATFFATNSSTVSCGLFWAQTAEAVRPQAIKTVVVSLKYIITRVNDSVRPRHTQCPCQRQARVASASHLMTYLSLSGVTLENRVPRAGFFDSHLGHPRRKNVHRLRSRPKQIVARVIPNRVDNAGPARTEGSRNLRDDHASPLV